MGIVNSKTKQNLVVLIEPKYHSFETPLKGGNMILNRFCIDEDAAFELSRVNYLKKYRGISWPNPDPKKGKEQSENFIHSYNKPNFDESFIILPKRSF